MQLHYHQFLIITNLQQMKKKQALNKNQPIKQLFLQMKSFYPYGHLQYKDCECIIRFKQIFEDHDYQQTKKQIERYCRLKHKNLLEILRAIQCQKNGYFQILYEYVHNGLETSLQKLKQQNITSFKEQLIDLCKYLIFNNINPKIRTDLIGFQEDKLKYFLSLENSIFVENLNKKQLIALKIAQIDSFFRQLIRKKHLNRKKSARQFTSTSRAQNFHNASTSNFNSNFPNKRSRKSSLTNANSVGSAHSNKNMESPTFDKIRSIDDKINELLSKMRKSSVKLSQIKNRSKQNNILLKKSSQQDPKPNNINIVIETKKNSNNQKSSNNCNIVSPKPILKINQQKNIKKLQMISPKFTTFKNELLTPPSNPKFFDQQSMDTYNIELGQNVEMPKIINPEMRQTTKSPPKLLFKQKMHESVGNKLDQEFLKELKAINAKLNFNQKQKGKQHDIGQIKKQEPKKQMNKTNENSNFKKKNFQPQQKAYQLKSQKEKLNGLTNSAEVIKNKFNPYIIDTKNELKNATDKKNKMNTEIPTNLNEKNDKTKKSNQAFNASSASPAKKQILKPEVYGFDEMLKNYEIKDQIVGDFNNLFETPTININNTQNSNSNKSRSVSQQVKGFQQSKNLIQSLFKQRKNSLINERVKQALLKSEATLQIYKRLNNCKK